MVRICKKGKLYEDWIYIVDFLLSVCPIHGKNMQVIKIAFDLAKVRGGKRYGFCIAIFFFQ